MNPPGTILHGPAWPRLLPFFLAGTAGGILALSNHPAGFGLFLAGAAAYLLFTLVSIFEPLILVTALLLVLEVLPPFYFSQWGETPIYVSFFALPIVVVVIVMWLPDLKWQWDPVATGLLAFLVTTALSIPFAFWLSDTSTGLNSLSRWVLLSHAAPIYFLIRACGHRRSGETEQGTFRLLLLGSVVAAAYGIVDFFWPIPLPHPAADQFIWLEGAVVRRAQGAFYESSNFANFCGFFLTMSSVAFLARQERLLGVSRYLIIVFITILSLAILVAFSRSAWASVLTALCVSLLFTRIIRIPRGIAVVAALAIPLCFLWIFFPGLWDYFVSGRVARLFEILDDPNSATSGRFDTWVRVLAILRDNPQYLLFGIGYKTLNLTRLYHGELVVDNGYLSLVLETGLVGLAGFLLWSAAILKTFFRLAHSAHAAPAFWGTVLFSIWCGELVQLLAADAYTYWRNIALLTALMAITLNLAERVEQPDGAA